MVAPAAVVGTAAVVGVVAAVVVGRVVVGRLVVVVVVVVVVLVAAIASVTFNSQSRAAASDENSLPFTTSLRNGSGMSSTLRRMSYSKVGSMIPRNPPSLPRYTLTTSPRTWAW